MWRHFCIGFIDFSIGFIDFMLKDTILLDHISSFSPNEYEKIDKMILKYLQ